MNSKAEDSKESFQTVLQSIVNTDVETSEFTILMQGLDVNGNMEIMTALHGTPANMIGAVALLMTQVVEREPKSALVFAAALANSLKGMKEKSETTESAEIIDFQSYTRH